MSNTPPNDGRGLQRGFAARPACAQARPEAPCAPTPPAHAGRILELDGLRALAVLAVISFHYTLGTPLANRVTGLGWIGVDLFFVLSGYLITGILLRTRGQAGYFSTFYKRRALRILPVYYLLLGIYVLAARFWGGPQPWGYWAMHAGFLSSTVEYFHFWNFAAPGFVFAGVTVLWSLSIEEQFYLIWAPVVKWLRPRGLWICLGLVLAGAPALRFALHGHGFREYRFLPTRFDSLGWGAALALLLQRYRAGGERTARWLLGTGAAAATALAALLAITGGRRENLWFATFGYTLLAVFFAAVVGWVVMRAQSSAPVCRLLRLRSARYLGRISYTVYLVHYPLLLLAGSLLPAWAHPAAGPLGLAGSLAVAAASWKFLEGPLQARKQRSHTPRAEARHPEFAAELGNAGLRTVEVAATAEMV